jgi:hypothetical protein
MLYLHYGKQRFTDSKKKKENFVKIENAENPNLSPWAAPHSKLEN